MKPPIVPVACSAWSSSRPPGSTSTPVRWPGWMPMGQEFLTQRHLALANHGERSAEGGWCLGRGSGLCRCLSLHHTQGNSAWHPNRCALRNALQLVELFAEH